MRSFILFRTIMVMCFSGTVLMLDAKTMGYEILTAFGVQPSEAYHVKKDVLAFELRKYQSIDMYENYTVVKGIYLIPKYQIESLLRKNFDTARPNLSKEGDIMAPSQYKGDMYRGFVLYENGKVLRLNEIADIVAYLNGVDTVAEAQFVIWLHLNSIGKEYVKAWSFANTHLRMKVTSQKYRKVKMGYEVILNFFITDDINNISQSFVESLTISFQGEIMHHKQLKRSKINDIYPEACGYGIFQGKM